MKTIRHTTTLFYYDGAQVFEARDAIGGHYVAVMVEPENGRDRYLVAGVAPERLRQFRSGTLDLRSLLSEGGEEEWYLWSNRDPRGDFRREDKARGPELGGLETRQHLPLFLHRGDRRVRRHRPRATHALSHRARTRLIVPNTPEILWPRFQGQIGCTGKLVHSLVGLDPARRGEYDEEKKYPRRQQTKHMAAARQILELLRSHLESDEERFRTAALQLAANEARNGHEELAKEIQKVLEGSPRIPKVEPEEQGTNSIPFSRQQGELAGLLGRANPAVRNRPCFVAPKAQPLTSPGHRPGNRPQIVRLSPVRAKQPVARG